MIKHEKDWVKGSTLSTAEAESSHGLLRYETELGFNRKELEGKTVLDLGSGAVENFSRELKKSGIKSNVISLNPDYLFKEVREMAINKPDWQKKSVAAVAQELPFQDNSFDFVLALNSISLYANPRQNKEATRLWLNEIKRVLKSGGKAIISPLRFCPIPEEKEPTEYSSFIKDLRKAGYIVEIQSLPGENTSDTRLVIQKPSKNIKGK